MGCRSYEETQHIVPPVEKKPRGALVLPEKDKNLGRTIACLTQTRGIDKEIVYAMIKQGKVYGARTVSKKTGDSLHNCAFVGYDEGGSPRTVRLGRPALEAISGWMWKTQTRLMAFRPGKASRRKGRSGEHRTSCMTEE